MHTPPLGFFLLLLFFEIKSRI